MNETQPRAKYCTMFFIKKGYNWLHHNLLDFLSLSSVRHPRYGFKLCGFTLCCPKTIVNTFHSKEDKKLEIFTLWFFNGALPAFRVRKQRVDSPQSCSAPIGGRHLPQNCIEGERFTPPLVHEECITTSSSPRGSIDVAWTLRSYHREYIEWLHKRLVRKLHRPRMQSSAEGGANDSVYHWGDLPAIHELYIARGVRGWLGTFPDFSLLTSGKWYPSIKLQQAPRQLLYPSHRTTEK
jgi:hypothetical protein